MENKQYHTAQSLAEMIILCTFIADLAMDEPVPNSRQRSAIKRVNDARTNILTRVTEANDSDNEVYEASEKMFNRYYINMKKADFVYICRGNLGVYLRNYNFGHEFFNLFKDVWRYSSQFGKGGVITKKNSIEFVRELRSLTNKAELEITT